MKIVESVQAAAAAKGTRKPRTSARATGGATPLIGSFDRSPADVIPPTSRRARRTGRAHPAQPASGTRASRPSTAAARAACRRMVRHRRGHAGALRRAADRREQFPLARDKIHATAANWWPRWRWSMKRTAERALALIAVEYEVPPGLFSPQAARARPARWRSTTTSSPTTCCARGARRVRRQRRRSRRSIWCAKAGFTFAEVNHAHMEPNATLAEYDMESATA